jgi:hypothetical protein
MDPSPVVTPTFSSDDDAVVLLFLHGLITDPRDSSWFLEDVGGGTIGTSI